MFAPEGYWSWNDMMECIPDWARELTVATKYPSLASEYIQKNQFYFESLLQGKLVADGFVESQYEADFAIEISTLWLTANFMDSFEAVLCSPTGITMRCPPQLLAHGDAFDWWSWPMNSSEFGSGQSYQYLRFFREGAFKSSDAYARFCAVDHSSGRIKLKPNSINLFRGSSYGHGVDDVKIHEFIDDQVRPFVGWSVCWNPENVPDTTEEIFSELGFTDLDWSLFDLSKNARRKKSNVLDCVLQAFPNGKGDVTWDEVQRQVGYSRRSIIRSLKQNGEWTSWSEGGQN